MMLDAAMNFSNQMVAARMKPRPKVDKEREQRDIEIMERTGTIFGIKKTINKIKDHGNKKSSRLGC
jgi:hypothetical protein